jgi:hypothetical protein
LVISDKAIPKDLKAIFAEYPKKKVEIFWTDGYEEPKRIKKWWHFFNSKKTRDD